MGPDLCLRRGMLGGAGGAAPSPANIKLSLILLLKAVFCSENYLKASAALLRPAEGIKPAASVVFTLGRETRAQTVRG